MAATRLRLRYRKDEVLRYVGHRDLLRYVLKLFRRAELPLATTGSFSPKPRVIFGPALPLGALADNELLDFQLAADTSWLPDDTAQLAAKLKELAEPRDFVVELRQLADDEPSISSLVTAGLYRLGPVIDQPEIRSLLASAVTAVPEQGKPFIPARCILAYELHNDVLSVTGGIGHEHTLNIMALAGCLEKITGAPISEIRREWLLTLEGRRL